LRIYAGADGDSTLDEDEKDTHHDQAGSFATILLLLVDAPAFPGCVVESRLMGVIEGEQDEGGKKERNDRLVAVAQQSHTHSDLKKISEVI
jgi:Inorganic pyrophosphatase